jgi:WD40 repeat protein
MLQKAPTLCHVLVRLAATATLAATAHASAAGEASGNAPAPPVIEMAIQPGHSAEIHGLQYAPSGQFFATGSKDSTIKLWSPAGTLIRTIPTGFWVECLAISRDSRLLLAAARTGTMALFSTEGRLMRSLPALTIRDGFIDAVALSPDGRYAAIGTTRQIVLYRLEDAAVSRLQIDGSAPDVDDLLFTPDGRLISAHADGQIRFWSGNGKAPRTIAALDYPVRTLALSPDGKTLASAGSFLPFAAAVAKPPKLQTKLWDLEGNLIAQFPSHATCSLRFTADGQYLVSGGRNDNHVNIYRRNGELVRTIRVGTGSHRSPYLIALSPDDRTLVTADEEFDSPGLGLWSLDGGFVRALGGGAGGTVNNAVWSPDGQLIVTVSLDRIVRLWSPTGRLLAALPGHQGYAEALAFAPNGKVFASGGDEVILWSRTGEKLGTVAGFSNGAAVLAFSPDSHLLFCGDGAGSVHVFDLQSKKTRHMKLQDGRITALAVHPSGELFATGGAREHVSIWDLDGKLQGESRFEGSFNHPVSAAYALAFSPDGEQLVAGTTNPEKTLQIFDRRARLVDAIKAPIRYQNGSLAISASGRLLAATVNDRVNVYDWTTHQVVRVLKGHSGEVSAVGIAPDDAHVLTAGRDGTTRLWRLDNGYSMSLLSGGTDWIVYTPDGYFDASHYGGELIAIVHGLDTFGVDQFALQLNRPDLILSRLGIGSPEFVEHLHSRYQRRLELSGFREGPASVDLQAPEVRLLEARQEGKFAQLGAQITAARYPLQSYQIYVNNVPLFPGHGKPLTGSEARVDDRVELSQGDNKVEIGAFDSRGVEAFRAHWNATYHTTARGDLYYIGFGVSHYLNPALNLQFADKDVLDLAAALQRYAGSFRRVVAKTYVNEAVTTDNIAKAKELLKDAGVNDTVIVLVSGHGAYDLSKQATYYYGTYNVDPDNLAATGASFDEIEALLRDIAPRRKLMLLDTCESGEMDDAARADLLKRTRGAGLAARTSPAFQQDQPSRPRRVFLYERDRYIYNDLARRSGAIIFSASHGGEMSFESPKIQNGFFTHEVIQALRTRDADTDHDGEVSVDELEAYVTLNVASKTGGLQRPTVDRDNLAQRFGLPILQAGAQSGSVKTSSR